MMNSTVKKNAARAGRVASKAGRAALREGAAAAVAAGQRKFKNAIASEKRRVAAKTLGKVVLVSAAAVGAGLLVKSRMK